MKLSVVTTIYKQNANILDFYAETEKVYFTNRYNCRDPYIAMERILNDFEKLELINDTNKVSVKKLFINDKMVAALEPWYTIENKTYYNWSELYNQCANSKQLSIGDCKLHKHLNIYDYNTLLNTIHEDFINTFSE